MDPDLDFVGNPDVEETSNNNQIEDDTIWSMMEAFLSPLDKLLDKTDITIEEILDEDKTLQEYRGEHPKLVKFVMAHVDDVLEHLLIISTVEEANQFSKLPENRQKQLFKYPFVCSEIVNMDKIQFNNSIAEDKGRLERLFGYLQKREPGVTSPSCDSYFLKALMILSKSHYIKVTDYILSSNVQQQDGQSSDVLSLLMKNMDIFDIDKFIVFILTHPLENRRQELQKLFQEKKFFLGLFLSQNNQSEEGLINALTLVSEMSTGEFLTKELFQVILEVIFKQATTVMSINNSTDNHLNFILSSLSTSLNVYWNGISFIKSQLKNVEFYPMIMEQNVAILKILSVSTDKNGNVIGEKEAEQTCGKVLVLGDLRLMTWQHIKNLSEIISFQDTGKHLRPFLVVLFDTLKIFKWNNFLYNLFVDIVKNVLYGATENTVLECLFVECQLIPFIISAGRKSKDVDVKAVIGEVDVANRYYKWHFYDLALAIEKCYHETGSYDDKSCQSSSYSSLTHEYLQEYFDKLSKSSSSVLSAEWKEFIGNEFAQYEKLKLLNLGGEPLPISTSSVNRGGVFNDSFELISASLGADESSSIMDSKEVTINNNNNNNNLNNNNNNNNSTLTSVSVIKQQSSQAYSSAGLKTDVTDDSFNSSQKTVTLDCTSSSTSNNNVNNNTENQKVVAQSQQQQETDFEADFSVEFDVI